MAQNFQISCKITSFKLSLIFDFILVFSIGICSLAVYGLFVTQFLIFYGKNVIITIHLVYILHFLVYFLCLTMTCKSVHKYHNGNKRDHSLFFCVILGSDWQAVWTLQCFDVIYCTNFVHFNIVYALLCFNMYIANLWYQNKSINQNLYVIKLTWWREV